MIQEQIFPVAFISAELESLDVETNATRTKLLEQDLKECGLKYKIVEGCYKGSKEASFCVGLADAIKDVALLQQIAKTYKQEAILTRDATKKCKLILSNNQIEQLGYMEKVSKEFALTQQNYTYDPETGEYYAIK